MAASLGKKIKMLRTEKGLTQAELLPMLYLAKKKMKSL